MQRTCQQLLIAGVLLSGGLFARALSAEEAAWPTHAAWKTIPAVFPEPADQALTEVLQASHTSIETEAQTVSTTVTTPEADPTGEPPLLLETPVTADTSSIELVEAGDMDEVASVDEATPEVDEVDAASEDSTFSVFGEPRKKRESTTVPEVPEDMFAEFESLAFWTGMVVLIAIAGLFIMKYRFPELQGLKTNGRLQKVAHLQLRPDAQVLLVEADGQRYIVALDRQGIKTMQPVAAWSELSESAERELLADS